MLKNSGKQFLKAEQHGLVFFFLTYLVNDRIHRMGQVISDRAKNERKKL